MNAPETIKTPITDLFGIKYPIMLAGMNVAAGPELAAAVSNNGGLGVIGGVGYTVRARGAGGGRDLTKMRVLHFCRV